MALRYTHVVEMIDGDGLLHYERPINPHSSRVLACNDKTGGRYHQLWDRAVNAGESAPTCLWCAAGKAR